jgi:hypothetical protein
MHFDKTVINAVNTLRAVRNAAASGAAALSGDAPSGMLVVTARPEEGGTEDGTTVFVYGTALSNEQGYAAGRAAAEALVVLDLVAEAASLGMPPPSPEDFDIPGIMDEQGINAAVDAVSSPDLCDKLAECARLSFTDYHTVPLLAVALMRKDAALGNRFLAALIAKSANAARGALAAGGSSGYPVPPAGQGGDPRAN